MAGPSLVDNLPILLGLVGIGVLIGMRLQKVLWQLRRIDHRRGNWRDKRGKVVPFQSKPDAISSKVPDAADQLRTVMKADFRPQALLNKSEARLFRAMDKMVIELAPPGWQVMAQVSLGEILRCEDADAYRCINSKRVDLLIVDADCKPLDAIEYQGGGHFKGAHATAARDAVKKEALRRAGIGYEEIRGGEMSAAELRRLVERLVRRRKD